MGPRDHRIHLGRRDSLKTSPQNHSSTKHVFSGPCFVPKTPPSQNVAFKIFPEADFKNFSKSLQKVRTANSSQILNRIHTSKLQTEPRGEKHVSFCVFFQQKSNVWCWKPNIYALFLRFWTYTWDASCQKPNIYEFFLGFWTQLGCLVSETQHLRIIFGILDPPGGPRGL